MARGVLYFPLAILSSLSTYLHVARHFIASKIYTKVPIAHMPYVQQHRPTLPPAPNTNAPRTPHPAATTTRTKATRLDQTTIATQQRSRAFACARYTPNATAAFTANKTLLLLLLLRRRPPLPPPSSHLHVEGERRLTGDCNAEPSRESSYTSSCCTAAPVACSPAAPIAPATGSHAVRADVVSAHTAERRRSCPSPVHRQLSRVHPL